MLVKKKVSQAASRVAWDVHKKGCFAQEWFPKMNSEPPATALARAQHWLRTVTNRELQQWRYGQNDAEEMVRVGAGQQGDPDAFPYADPVYWAGFQITGW